MAANDSVDQDAIAAQWEASLDSEDPAVAAEAAASNELSGTMALQWAAMVEDGSRDFGSGKNSGERVLSQEEIDNLLGFSVGDVNLDEHSGIRAVSRISVLALGGLFISTPKPPPVGDAIQLIFEVPGGDVRARAIVRDSQQGKGMGVEFTAMGPEARARLNQLMNILSRV